MTYIVAKCAAAVIFAISLGCFLLSAYALVSTQAEAFNRIDDVSRDHSNQIPLTDDEKLDFAAAVREAQNETGGRIAIVVIAGGFLMLVGVVLALLIRYRMRQKFLRSTIASAIVFCVVLPPFVIAEVIYVYPQLGANMPNREDYCLSEYWPLLSPARPGLSLHEKFLLEEDPDPVPPVASDRALLRARANLRQDPEGLRHQTAKLLVPTAVLKSRVAARFVAGPSLDTLHVLNVLDGQLHALDLRTNRVLPNPAVLSPATGGACYSRDGGMIYAVARTGVLYSIRASDLQVQETIPLDFTAFDIACDKSGKLLLISGEKYVSYWDIAIHSMLGSMEIPHEGNGKILYYVPVDDLLFCSPFDGSQPWAIRIQPSLHSILPGYPAMIDDATINKNIDPLREETHPLRALKLYGGFTISPEGDYALFCGRTELDGYETEGTVLDLRSEQRKRVIRKVPPHHTLAWDHKRQLAFIAYTTGGGELSQKTHGVMGLLDVYSLPDWKKLQTFQLPRPAYQLAWDAARRQLIAALDDDKDVQRLAFTRGESVGNLARSSNRKQSLWNFRTANRVTGPDEGPLCVFDLSKEIE